jgi:hypothetical protein
LRLSYVLFRDEEGAIKNLKEVDPQATVRVCRVQERKCITFSIRETDEPQCLHPSRLDITTKDLTVDGISIRVHSPRLGFLGEAENAGHRNGITERAVCEGLVFGARFFEGRIHKIAFFLDDAPPSE